MITLLNSERTFLVHINNTDTCFIFGHTLLEGSSQGIRCKFKLLTANGDDVM